MAGLDVSGPRAQGAAMAALSPKLRGKADMKLVSEIVRSVLAGRRVSPRFHRATTRMYKACYGLGLETCGRREGDGAAGAFGRLIRFASS